MPTDQIPAGDTPAASSKSSTTGKPARSAATTKAPARGKTTTPRKTGTKAGAKTAAKPAAAKKPAAKTRVRPETVKPNLAVVGTSEPIVAANELKKAELIEQVVERSAIKKRDAKPVVEALLAVLGEALEEGRELNLKPFGKLKPVRKKTLTKGVAMTVRLRRTNIDGDEGRADAKDGLAKPAKGG